MASTQQTRRRRGKVRPHDPFDLIRWLALSQPDPRKALAELVQNSLDAGARRVHITRARVKGVPTLRVLDDGEGVIPELSRPDALTHIATHIGHSRKRSLSPEERMRLMAQGQYGIGLLGFWSIGQELEMRTRVPGEAPMRLVLQRDRPEFEVEPLSGRLPAGERWTEVIVRDVLPDALPNLSARRAARYLAAELRGQLLERDVEVWVEDRMARGRAPKLLPVEPARYLGERIDELETLVVEGFPPARLEIYFADPAADPSQTLAAYAAGTLVAETFHELGNIGLDHSPWTDPRLCGAVDFSAFQVSPGSRRKVVVDAAAGAFARALRTLEPTLTGLLEEREREQVAAADRNLVRDLRRALRDFFRERPTFSMLPVAEKGSEAARGEDGPGGGAGLAADLSVDAAGEETDVDFEDLVPAGPLYAVAVTPTPIRIERHGTRRVRARPLDRKGRPIRSGVEFAWELDPQVGRLASPASGHPVVVIEAGGACTAGALTVVATEDGGQARARRTVQVVEQLETARKSEGVPTPEFVNDAAGSWRSRMVGGRWQVNAAHREFRAVADRPALKLRYVAMLFAKEVVLRSHSDPRLVRPLEQLVEVAAYADRNHAAARPGRRPRADPLSDRPPSAAKERAGETRSG